MAERKQTDFADSFVWKIISVTGNAITLNLLFLASCLPVIAFTVLKVIFNKTVFSLLFYASLALLGPALCGLFSAVRFYLRKDGWFEGFKVGYRQNILQMMAVSLISSSVIVYLADIVFAIAKNYKTEALFSLVPNAVILALILAFFASLIVYNVFFPRGFIDLLTEAASFVFKAPLQLVITGALLWLPLVFILAFPSYATLFLIVVLAVYFSMAAMIGIGLLKDPLIKVLTAKRESGELPPLAREDKDE